MGSPFLDTYIGNATFAIERQTRQLEKGSLESPQGIHALCTMFRQRGVCDLLLTAQTESFFVNMMQSAAAFLHSLRTTRIEEKVTSFAKPFFDAIVGSYWGAARDIATESRPTWNSDYEYEDDFVYVFFLMQQFFLDGSEEVLDESLARYERVLNGASDTRLGICRAFRRRDETLFHDSLTLLLEERRDKVDELMGRGALTDEQEAWVQYFSNEGAALLKLADRFQLRTGTHYLDIPEAVRVPSPWLFSENAWRNADFTPQREKST